MSVYNDLFDEFCKTLKSGLIFGCVASILFCFIVICVIPCPHCIKCDERLRGTEKFCPYCGQPTDSVNTYNIFTKQKYKKL